MLLRRRIFGRKYLSCSDGIRDQDITSVHLQPQCTLTLYSYVLLHHITSHLVMLRQITSCYVTLRYITSCYIIHRTRCNFTVMSRYITLRHVSLCYLNCVLLCLVTLHRVSLCYVKLHLSSCNVTFTFTSRHFFLRHVTLRIVRSRYVYLYVVFVSCILLFYVSFLPYDFFGGWWIETLKYTTN